MAAAANGRAVATVGGMPRLPVASTGGFALPISVGLAAEVRHLRVKKGRIFC